MPDFSDLLWPKGNINVPVDMPLNEMPEPVRRMLGRWRCTCCGAELNGRYVRDSRWRWNGERWEHVCETDAAQVGHMPAEPVGGDDAS